MTTHAPNGGCPCSACTESRVCEQTLYRLAAELGALTGRLHHHAAEILAEEAQARLVGAAAWLSDHRRKQ